MEERDARRVWSAAATFRTCCRTATAKATKQTVIRKPEGDGGAPSGRERAEQPRWRRTAHLAHWKLQIVGGSEHDERVGSRRRKRSFSGAKRNKATVAAVERAAATRGE